MLQVRKSNIIPARICNTRPITRRKRVDGTRKVPPCEILHDHTRVVGAADGSSVLKLCLRATLIDVGLGDEDGERDVVSANVGPSDIFRDALATLPGFEPCSVDSVDSCDVVEMDIGDVGKSALVLAQRSDAHSMALIPNGTTLEEDVMSSGLHCDRIVAIEDDAVGDPDVRCSNVEAVSVERKAAGG